MMSWCSNVIIMSLCCLAVSCDDSDTQTNDKGSTSMNADTGVRDQFTPQATAPLAGSNTQMMPSPMTAMGGVPGSADGCPMGFRPDCQGPNERRICENGEYKVLPCPDETSCQDGSCAPKECQPSQQFCIDENSLGLCDETGTNVTVRPCNGLEKCRAESNRCVCEVPVQILFLLDASGSMQLNMVDGLTRWEHARNAIESVMTLFPNITYGLKTFPLNPIDCPMPGCASGGGCALADNQGLTLPLGTSSNDILNTLANRQLSANGSPLENVLTPLHSAFKNLVDMDLGRFKTDMNSPRHIILISDGEDKCLAPHAPGLVPGQLSRLVDQLGRQWGIQTHAVGFGVGEGSTQLAAIAQAGGTGRARPLLATSGDELREMVGSIARAIDSKSCVVDAASFEAPDCAASGLTDADMDRSCSDIDCDDNDNATYPGAVEVPGNQRDEDCDGERDEADGYIPPRPDGMRGCQGIDFLFIIDNSGSMGDEQDNLAESIPGFLDAIAQAAPTGDYHIMVVDSDESGLTGSSMSNSCRTINGDTTCECFPAPECCEAHCMRFGPNAICNGSPACNQPAPPVLEMCDETLGAGRTYSGIYQECLPGPQRFLSNNGVNLRDSFGCLARVGAGGDGNERMMDAMVNAVTAPLTAPAGCNAGFLRNDSTLVVTFITDEPHNERNGQIDAWRNALIQAKNGNANAITVLGIFSDVGLPNAICQREDPAPIFKQFLDSWGEQSHFCSVCLDNYGQCLGEAVVDIATTCENFVTE